jgi:hypothetical protein
MERDHMAHNDIIDNGWVKHKQVGPMIVYVEGCQSEANLLL